MLAGEGTGVAVTDGLKESAGEGVEERYVVLTSIDL